jgi:mycothiol S-conjugate amidase
MHQAALMAYFVAGDARAYPQQLNDGLAPWTPSKLYWTAFPRSRWQKFAELSRDRGIDISKPMKEFLKRAMPDEIITTRIDVAEYVDLKIVALDCHASQLNPESFFRKIPQDVRRDGLRVETLVRAESRVAPMQEIEEDLFVGIERS